MKISLVHLLDPQIPHFDGLYIVQNKKSQLMTGYKWCYNYGRATGKEYLTEK